MSAPLPAPGATAFTAVEQAAIAAAAAKVATGVAAMRQLREFEDEAADFQRLLIAAAQRA